MGIQNTLHCRGIDNHRFARRLFHFGRHLRGHQRRHPGRPCNPDIAFLPGQAEDQRLCPRPVDQRAFLLLDRELAFLRLLDC